MDLFNNFKDKIGPAPAEMKLGDKGVLPTAAAVVSRFPKVVTAESAENAEKQ